jgi:hypothetical protein
MANLTIDIDLPENTTIAGYHRLPDAHGIEVAWPLPTRAAVHVARPSSRHAVHVYRSLRKVT